MANMRKTLIFLMMVWGIGCGMAAAAPTYGDLAVMLAKSYFKGRVASNASLEQCVAFLNDHGVEFSLFQLLDSKARVSKEDFARAVGQSHLLLLGEAHLDGGAIQRPKGIGSWIDYCLLNDVDTSKLWKKFIQRTEHSSLPEVKKFFGDVEK